MSLEERRRRYMSVRSMSRDIKRERDEARAALSALYDALDNGGWTEDPSWDSINAVERAMEDARELLGRPEEEPIL